MDEFKPFACDVCGESFWQKRELKMHKMLLLKTCDICDISFPSTCALNTHCKIQAGEKSCRRMDANKTLPCDIFRIEYGSNYKIEADNPFPCGICGKAFKTQTKLKRHTKVHTQEKPHECKICQKTFIERNTLARHTRVHTGEKSYECEICKKTFSLRGHLTNHKRIHTGEKPYSCNICQKSFTQRSGLSYHMKTSAHLKRKETKNEDLSFLKNTFVDCGETIKLEDIKGEIKEEEIVKDPLSIHKETENSNICEDIKEEIKEEESVDDPLSLQEVKIKKESDNIHTEVKEEGIDDDTLFVQEIHNYGDEENNTVVGNIDMYMTQN